MAIVALLTDFGTRDHYVGTMKGVVLSVCPDATLVDITHDIAPQDVASGALELAAAYEYFPAATVFLAVVDPGVGSARRAIAATAGGYSFVGPDNGLFSEVFRGSPPSVIVELCERKYARSVVSRTFEGRDRFAPAAGWLARGVDITAFGPPVADYQHLDLPQPTISGTTVTGEVVRVDSFGNLITNIERQAIDALPTRELEIRIDAHRIRRLIDTYADASAGELCALIGSTGRLEISVNGGNAADRMRLSRGARVFVTIPGA